MIEIEKNFAEAARHCLIALGAGFAIFLGGCIAYTGGGSVLWAWIGLILFSAIATGGAILLAAALRLSARTPRVVLEALLSDEGALGERAIDKAKDAYAAIKPAAQDEFDDTGYDEPWEAAIEAALSYGIEEINEVGTRVGR